MPGPSDQSRPDSEASLEQGRTLASSAPVDGLIHEDVEEVRLCHLLLLAAPAVSTRSL